MNEKTKLLELFKKAADSADMFKDDKREVMGSPMLSEKGKKHEIGENRRLFAEAMEGYREQMLAIVNKREEDYTAYYVKVAQSRMSTSSYQAALTANLEMLSHGYAGKIEVMALLKLYKDDDLAYSQIEDVMHKTNSPYCNLLEDRITIKKQLNVFESIRRVIKSKVNAYLTEQPVYKPTATAQSGIKKDQFSRESCYFGSGYVAIVEELEEDLTITRPDATLALKNNSDANMDYNPGSNVDVIRAEHGAQENSGTVRQNMQTTQEEHLTDPATFPGVKQD